MGLRIAQHVAESSPGMLEQRPERMERAIAPLEAKHNGRQSGGGMMEGCRNMMGGAAPNEQWRSSDQKR